MITDVPRTYYVTPHAWPRTIKMPKIRDHFITAQGDGRLLAAEEVA